MDAEVVEVDLTSPSEKPRRPPPTPPVSPLVHLVHRPSSPASTSAVVERRGEDWSTASSSCHGGTAVDAPGRHHSAGAPGVAAGKQSSPEAAVTSHAPSASPPKNNLSLDVLRMLAQQQQDAYDAKLREVAAHELRLRQWGDDLAAKEAYLQRWEQRLTAAPQTTLTGDRSGVCVDAYDTMGAAFTGGGDIPFAERFRMAKRSVERSDLRDATSTALYAPLASRRQ